MKYQIILFLVSAVAARPAHSMHRSHRSLHRRQVPQEHAHENILRAVNTVLKQNNPDNIQDAVFGLLGAKAAAEGKGNIADPDCLQQATADQAFTNAKAAGDVNGMTNALIFRALERNTGSVGLASVPCTSIQAKNPEIAALQQHQDAAGQGAEALNKQIAAELARQIKAVGGDPALANEASTFAPGKLGDPTAKGNTCDDANDAAGCINTLKLRVDDLSAAEIEAAVAGGAPNNTLAAVNGTLPAANATAYAFNATASALNATSLAYNATASATNATLPAANATAPAANSTAGTANSTGSAEAGKPTQAAPGNANGNANGSANGNASQGGETQASGFGKCSNPTIKFGQPSDGRQQDAFEPANLSDFNHGSALNIAVISNFICSQVKSACKADAAAVTKCDAAASAAQGKQGAAAADAFNQAIAN